MCNAFDKLQAYFPLASDSLLVSVQTDMLVYSNRKHNLYSITWLYLTSVLFTLSAPRTAQARDQDEVAFFLSVVIILWLSFLCHHRNTDGEFVFLLLLKLPLCSAFDASRGYAGAPL